MEQNKPEAWQHPAWKQIVLQFSRALTDKEERILIAQFKIITERMRDVVKGGLRAYDNPLTKATIGAVGGAAIAKTMASQLQFIADNMYQYVRLEKSPAISNCYTFRVKENVLKIQPPIGETIDIWDKLKKKVNLKFKLELCKAIGIYPGELKIQFEEGFEDGTNETSEGKKALPR